MTCTGSTGETFCAVSPGICVTLAGLETAAGETFCSVCVGWAGPCAPLELHAAKPSTVATTPTVMAHRVPPTDRRTATPSPEPLITSCTQSTSQLRPKLTSSNVIHITNGGSGGD